MGNFSICSRRSFCAVRAFLHLFNYQVFFFIIKFTFLRHSPCIFSFLLLSTPTVVLIFIFFFFTTQKQNPQYSALCLGGLDVVDDPFRPVIMLVTEFANGTFCGIFSVLIICYLKTTTNVFGVNNKN